MVDEILKVLVAQGQLLDPMRAQEALREGATVGEAEVMASPYGTPDTAVPTGLSEQYVIDDGTFDKLISGYAARAEKGAIPFFLDHGYAHLNPNQYTDSSLKIGKTVGLRSDKGLVAKQQWNLAKTIGRDAFADAVFDPYGTKFSYRWVNDDSYRSSDGKMHTTFIDDLKEISQLGLSAAQQETFVFPDTVKMRTSMHHTATTSSDKLGNVPTGLPPDLLRMAFAAMDPEGDPADIGVYLFPHHLVEGDGIGPAVVQACHDVIDQVNKMRGVSMEVRVAAYRHAAQHLHDAGERVEDLRAPMPTLDEFRAMVQDEGFKSDVESVMMRAVQEAPAVPEWALAGAHMRGHLTSSKEAKTKGHGKSEEDVRRMADTELQDAHWFDHFDDVGHTHPGMRTGQETVGTLMKARIGDVVKVLMDDHEYRSALEAALSDAESDAKLLDPGTWYGRMWHSRANV